LSKHGGGDSPLFSSYNFRFLVRIGWIEKTSNDDIARLISVRELECLLMCDPFGVKLFVKVFMNVSCFDLDLIESYVNP